MTTEEAVAALDAISGDDPEAAHAKADAIIETFVPPEVSAALTRLINRADDWWFA